MQSVYDGSTQARELYRRTVTMRAAWLAALVWFASGLLVGWRWL